VADIPLSPHTEGMAHSSLLHTMIHILPPSPNQPQHYSPSSSLPVLRNRRRIRLPCIQARPLSPSKLAGRWYLSRRSCPISRLPREVLVSASAPRGWKSTRACVYQMIGTQRCCGLVENGRRTFILLHRPSPEICIADITSSYTNESSLFAQRVKNLKAISSLSMNDRK
jgi:hypothetical protein